MPVAECDFKASINDADKEANLELFRYYLLTNWCFPWAVFVAGLLVLGSYNLGAWVIEKFCCCYRKNTDFLEKSAKKAGYSLGNTSSGVYGSGLPRVSV